jgi:hypothetical protein
MNRITIVAGLVMTSMLAFHPAQAQTSEPLSCDSVQAVMEAVAGTFVDQTQQLSCTTQADCVVSRVGISPCRSIVNQTAAAGYSKWFASDAFARLSQVEAGVCVGGGVDCAPVGAPACLPTGCAALAPTTCDEVHDLEQKVLATFVDPSNTRSCQGDGDCVVAAVPGFCHQGVVNRTAAAGYAAYFASAQLAALQSAARDLHCGGAGGACAPLGTPGCVQNSCVSRR